MYVLGMLDPTLVGCKFDYVPVSQDAGGIIFSTWSLAGLKTTLNAKHYLIHSSYDYSMASFLIMIKLNSKIDCLALFSSATKTLMTDQVLLN